MKKVWKNPDVKAANLSLTEEDISPMTAEPIPSNAKGLICKICNTVFNEENNGAEWVKVYNSHYRSEHFPNYEEWYKWLFS